jgi:hypothetical protein
LPGSQFDVHQYIGYLREKSLGAPVGGRRIGRQAMSAAERQRRYVERLKAAADNLAPGALDVKTVTARRRDATNTDRDEFLRELLRYLYFHTWLESKGIVTNETLNRSAPATRLDWLRRWRPCHHHHRCSRARNTTRHRSAHR